MADLTPIELARNAAKALIHPPEGRSTDEWMQAGLETMSAWSLLSIAESLAKIADQSKDHGSCASELSGINGAWYFCALPYGHDGMHKSREGTEWTP